MESNQKIVIPINIFFFGSKRTVFLCCSTANVQSSERNPIPRSLVDCVRVRHRMIYAEYARQPAKIPRIRIFIFYWINFVFYSVFCFFFLVLFWMPVIRWLTFFRQINRGKRGAEGTNAVNLNLWQNAWTNPSAYIYLLWKYGIMVMMMKMVIHLPHRMVDWL